MCTLFWVGWPNKLGVDVVVPKPVKPDVPVAVEAPNRGLLCPNKLVLCCCGCCGCCPNKEVPVEAGVGLNAAIIRYTCKYCTYAIDISEKEMYNFNLSFIIKSINVMKQEN